MKSVSRFLSLLCIVAAALAVPAYAQGSPPLQVQGFKIFTYGVGTNSCGKLVNDVKQPSGWVPYSSWLNGYLTGVNVYDSQAPQKEGRRDIRRNHDPESLVLWVEKYCRDNPLSTVMEAALMLVVELKRNDR